MPPEKEVMQKVIVRAGAASVIKLWVTLTPIVFGSLNGIETDVNLSF